MPIEIRNILFIIFILNNFSCNPKKNFTEKETSIQQQEKSQIVFLTLRISKTLDSNNKVELLKTFKTDGLIKKKFESEINSENYLTLELYSNNKLENTKKIEHPLFKEIEYYDDTNNIKKKSVVLNSSEFSVRLQTKKPNCSVKILETLNNISIKELITLKI